MAQAQNATVSGVVRDEAGQPVPGVTVRVVDTELRTITDEGVTFQSHIDGATHVLTPERAVEIQCLLGADIQMQLDECVALPTGRDETTRAV